MQELTYCLYMSGTAESQHKETALEGQIVGGSLTKCRASDYHLFRAAFLITRSRPQTTAGSVISLHNRLMLQVLHLSSLQHAGMCMFPGNRPVGTAMFREDSSFAL